MQIDTTALQRVIKELAHPINTQRGDTCQTTIGKVGGVWYRLTAISEDEAINQDCDEITPGDLCLYD